MAMRSATINDVAGRLGRDPRNAFDRTVPRGFRPAPPPPQPVAPARQVGWVRLLGVSSLVLLALAALILALAWLAGKQIAQGGHSADVTTRQIVIGNDVLDLPMNVIRFPSQRRAGEATRLDLYLRWPDMAGYTEEAAEAFNSNTIDPSILFVTIEPRSMSLDMSGRLGPIYSKFLKGPVLDGVAGLKRRALDDDSGYQGEELWYESASPYPFVMRCMAHDVPGATPYCMRDVHLGRDLTVTYRFHRSLIAEWMTIERAVRSSLRHWLRG